MFANFSSELKREKKECKIYDVKKFDPGLLTIFLLSVNQIGYEAWESFIDTSPSCPTGFTTSEN